METIILIIGVALIGYAIMAYNGLVKARQMAHEGWSGIDIQLKRRANLIPNLVETVKSYAAHESETLAEVTKMRTQVQSVAEGDISGRSAAEGLLGQALGRLMVVSEAYPDLKASANFQDLQNSLEELETEIQNARRYYNGTARDLNIKVESFPSNLIANHFKFEQMDYFELENPDDKVVPKVSF